MTEIEEFNRYAEEVQRLRKEAGNFIRDRGPEVLIGRTKKLTEDLLGNLTEINENLETFLGSFDELQNHLKSKKSTLAIGRTAVQELIKAKGNMVKILSYNLPEETVEKVNTRDQENYIRTVSSVRDSEEFNEHCRSLARLIGNGWTSEQRTPSEDTDETSVNTIDSDHVFASSPLISSNVNSHQKP